MSGRDNTIADLEIMARAVHYRDWIYRQLSRHIGQRVIEFGAGIGTFTELLLDRELVVPVDMHGPCIEYLKKRFLGREQVVPVMMDVASPRIREFASYRPDTVVCINVLEHVADDEAALSNIFAILRQGGKAALLVPAHPVLYGSIDRAVGHQRRYTRRMLRERLSAAGFRIRKMTAMNSIATVGWFLNNRIFKRTEESPAQVLFFDRFIVPWLRIAEHAVSPPCGLSLIVIAEKE